MSRRPSGRGFSLIECIIAAFIVTAGFLTVASMYPLSYQSATLSRNRSLAVRIGANLLEQVRAHPYGTALDPSLLAAETRVDMVEGNRTTVVFSKQINFASGGAIGTSTSSTDTATVTISWDEGTGQGGRKVHKQLQMSGGLSAQ